MLWLKNLLGSSNDSAVSGALNTIGVLLQHYPGLPGALFPVQRRL